MTIIELAAIAKATIGESGFVGLASRLLVLLLAGLPFVIVGFQHLLVLIDLRFRLYRLPRKSLGQQAIDRQRHRYGHSIGCCLAHRCGCWIPVLSLLRRMAHLTCLLSEGSCLDHLQWPQEQATCSSHRHRIS